ncbi:MAG: MogA/MoaB family molybdenum cofactor biosynthesis protein [Intestinibacter sp.]|uniref:MogA/MoaB family molybdenum cofactor biosynthesis protein n=1 Tax=Intestinibacter sp. TaxID=1965304 RepID=UPI0025C2A98D|nr:MogA/MoaB family molybdenum cofactor biosynthesis protein [Intestinibacter sp.]MCI6736613.1 MogA/MoaB family molybdenum cofactor biosynthesis protein [Intestinibacter sp.]
MYRVAIITASDKGSRGERVDESGAKIKEIVSSYNYEVVHYKVLPDDKETLANEMKYICDNDVADLILTTGGTGFSARDNTPEATLSIADKLVPGIPEAMRAYSMQITKRTMLSRAVSVIRKNTLIINLPGSPKAVKENLDFIVDSLDHGLDILKGNASECARK